jgi:hypothetical protein
MKKTLRTSALIALALFGLQSCKRGTSVLSINSQELFYEMDSVPTKGWYSLTKVAKYDVDEFVAQNNIKKEWLQTMTFKDIEFNIVEGNLKFSDYDSITVRAWCTGLDTVTVVTKQVLDSTAYTADKKKATVKTNSTFNALEYVSKGDVYMKVSVHTAHDTVPKGKIQATPHVDVLTELKRKLGI